MGKLWTAIGPLIGDGWRMSDVVRRYNEEKKSREREGGKEREEIMRRVGWGRMAKTVAERIIWILSMHLLRVADGGQHGLGLAWL